MNRAAASRLYLAGSPTLSAIMIAVDAIPDMLRTVANVTFDLVATAIAARPVLEDTHL